MTEEAIVQNASDVGQVKAAGSKVKKREIYNKEKIATVMSTKQGRSYIWGLLEYCKVFLPTFRIDPHQSAYAEGARLVGLEIMKHVDSLGIGPYDLMRKEAFEDKERGF